MTADPDAHSYHDLAGWYDALYDARGKDYAAEARALLAAARAAGTPAPTSLLDVACGTGRHLEVFRDEVAEVAGVDASAEMLEIARGRLGHDVPLVEADLRGFDLGQRFDVVTCLFSSIGHVHDGAELDAAVASMAAHVAPGGTLLVEPWLTPGAVTDGHRDLVTATSADGVIARAGSSRREDDVLVVEFAWAVASVGGVATREERHRMPLFSAQRYVTAVERAGLAGSWADEVAGLGTGRGLLVGHRAA